MCAPSSVHPHLCTLMCAPSCVHPHLCTLICAPSCVHPHLCTLICAPPSIHPPACHPSEYTFAEVVERNVGGNCWLLLDGMVLDVTRWLPEHPGGDTIIPNQGLNRDCTVFFELYHSSRESFLYLRHFYMGELKEEDRVKLAEQEDQQPSAEFMQQLWEYTHSFRLHGTTIRNL
ncbi:unnamed protein product [Closterium sp. NIES-53]